MPVDCPPIDPGETLSVLTHAAPAAVKAFAENLIDDLHDIEVLLNRTALVMVPYRDTTGGAIFHLGEVQVAEAQVRVCGGHEGYAVCVGRDLEQAVAVALIDGALAAGVAGPRIGAFVADQRAHLAAADEALMRDVEATRVVMETF